MQTKNFSYKKIRDRQIPLKKSENCETFLFKEKFESAEFFYVKNAKNFFRSVKSL